MDEYSEELLKQTIDFFQQAEGTTKEAEITFRVTGLFVPVLNELRYAGYHLAKWNLTRNNDTLEKARGHAQRALYDAKELVLYGYLDLVDAIIDGFGKHKGLLVKISPDYPKLKKKILEAKTFSSTKPDSDDFSARERFIKNCEKHIESLKEFHAAYTLMEEELCSQKAKDENVEYWTKVTVAVGIAGAIITAISIFN